MRATSASGNRLVQTLARHCGAADPGKLHVSLELFPQRPHQAGAELVAGFLADDEKHLQDASWRDLPPRARRSSNRPGHDAGDEKSRAVGGFNQRLGLRNDDFVRANANACKAGALHGFDGRRPDRRQIEPAILRRFGCLDQNAGLRSGRSGDRRAAVRRSAPTSRSVPSAASIASTRLSATTAAWPMSKGPIASISANPRAISARSRSDGWQRPSDPSGIKDFRRDLVGTEHSKAILLEQSPQAGQQMIVAAAEQPIEAGQQLDRRPIKAKGAHGGSHQSADAHHVAAAGLVRQAPSGAELPHRDPMVRVSRDA